MHLDLDILIFFFKKKTSSIYSVLWEKKLKNEFSN